MFWGFQSLTKSRKLAAFFVQIGCLGITFFISNQIHAKNPFPSLLVKLMEDIA